MRVLVVTPYSTPLSVGGFQSQVYNIVNNLRNLGVDVDFFNSESISISDYDILQIMSFNSSMRSLVSRFKHAGVPIVITPMCGSRSMPNIVIKIRQLLSKIPFMFTADRFDNMVLRLGDYYLPITKFEFNRLINVFHIPENKVEIIPNGLEDDFFSDDVITKELPFDKYLLVVGRIEHNKNQISLIRAVNQLGLNLIIVGEPGAYDLSYLEKCRAISGKNIFYWGVEKNKKILKYLYQKADLTVIPSLSEMAPLVVFESLKMKTPVVCTSHCGFTELNIPGLFFSDVSIKALVQAIKKSLLYDNALIGNQGVYSWNDIACMYLSVYNKLLNRKR